VTFVSEDMRYRVRKSRKQRFKILCFALQILGKAQNFCGAFINRHHFRPTGLVWLRSHGWCFIYAVEIKKEITAVKYNGLAFGGYKNHPRRQSYPHFEYRCSRRGRSTLSVDLTYRPHDNVQQKRAIGNGSKWTITVTLTVTGGTAGNDAFGNKAY